MKNDPERKKKLTKNLFNLNTILDLDPEAEKNHRKQKEKDPSPKKEEKEPYDNRELVPESYWYEEDEYHRISPEKLESEENGYQRNPPGKLESEEDEKSAQENLIFAWDEALIPESYSSEVDEQEKSETDEEDRLKSQDLYKFELEGHDILDDENRVKLKEALDLLKSLKPNHELITAIKLIEDVVNGRK